QAIGSSLYEYLEGIGKPVVRALQHIQAINASDEFAALVGIAPGTAMLLMTRVGYTADNTPIEITDTYCRNDYYDFVAELRRYDFSAELRP
ncbi:GntR family transcriptional regulator, partial [Salmonella enterica]